MKTPTQLARAHFARRLKAYMVREKIGYAGLIARLGVSLSPGAVSFWIKEKGLPSKELWPRVAQLLGVPVDELFLLGAPGERTERARDAEGDALERHLSRPDSRPARAEPPEREHIVADVLSYTVNEQGEAVLRLTARGPHHLLLPLLTLLSREAAIVPTGAPPEEEKQRRLRLIEPPR